MTPRTERKKGRRKFKVGDLVTWGTRCTNHRILEVFDAGVIVDDVPDGSFPRHYVPFVGSGLTLVAR